MMNTKILPSLFAIVAMGTLASPALAQSFSNGTPDDFMKGVVAGADINLKIKYDGYTREQYQVFLQDKSSIFKSGVDAGFHCTRNLSDARAQMGDNLKIYKLMKPHFEAAIDPAAAAEYRRQIDLSSAETCKEDIQSRYNLSR